MELHAIKLYRAVCPEELNELLQTNVFSAGPNALEGKWFAEVPEHAVAWGKWLAGSNNFHVIEASFRARDAKEFERWPHLDGIGPARYADLESLNKANPVVREWTV